MYIEVRHKDADELIVRGRQGWPIAPFEGNLYVQRKLVENGRFVPNYIPGFCPYKFLYVWLDYITSSGEKIKNLGWMYILPNPLIPFIWYRVGIPRNHPELTIVTNGVTE